MRMKDVHNFHLVMSRGMKKSLLELNIFENCKGLSGVIISILKMLSPELKREHMRGKQRLSRYKRVCEDRVEVREHAHVYLPGDLYRELKLMHQDLNFYSIAQLVREFLMWFLNFVDGCDGDVFVELKKIFLRCAAVEAKTRLSLRDYLKQLYHVIRHIPEKKRLVTVYNKDFSPFWIYQI